MQIIIWIVIAFLVVFLIWLLRRWIRRIVFILILLGIAFFIYWVFNPSWASRLWYNVRTFPQRLTSWFSDQTFLDYDNYKIDMSSIWDKIDVDFSDEGDTEDLNDKIDKDLDKNIVNGKKYNKKNDDESVKKSDSKSKSSTTINPFPNTIKFVKMPELISRDVNYDKDAPILTWYSKSDLMWIVSRYIETNLDADTNIFVTIEYEDSSLKPDRIILKTQPKSEDGIVLNESMLDLFISSQKLSSENIVVSLDENTEIENDDEHVDSNQVKKSEVSVKNGTSVKNTVTETTNISNKLSQKEQREAEEIFSILF